MIIKFALALFTIFLNGYIVLNFLSRNFVGDFLDIVCLSFAFGCGVIGIMIHFFHCFNIPVNILSLTIPQIILVALFLRQKRLNKNILISSLNYRIDLNFTQIILLLIIGFEVLYCFIDALSLPFVAWDAWCNYGFKAKVLFLEKGFPFKTWLNPVNLPHRDYPLLIPNLGLYLYLFLGAIDEPLFRFFDALFFPLLLLVLYSFLRRSFSKTISLVFIACLSTVPLLSREAASGYLDVILFFYFTLAIKYIFEYFHNANLINLSFSAILIGISMWIKNEGFAFWISIILSLGILQIFNKIDLSRKNLSFIVVIPFLIYLPWFIFKNALGLQSDYFNFSLRQIVSEFLVRFLFTAKVFANEIINLNHWNIFWFVFIASLLSLLFKKYRATESLLLALIIFFQMCFYGIIFIIWPVGLQEIKINIVNSVSRLMLQLLPLAFLLIALQIKKLNEFWTNRIETL